MRHGEHVSRLPWRPFGSQPQLWPCPEPLLFITGWLASHISWPNELQPRASASNGIADAKGGIQCTDIDDFQSRPRNLNGFHRPHPPWIPITDRLKDSCSQNKGITCTHIGISHKIDQWGSKKDGTSLQITNSAVQHCNGELQIAFDCLYRQCLHIHQNNLWIWTHSIWTVPGSIIWCNLFALYIKLNLKSTRTAP